MGGWRTGAPALRLGVDAHELPLAREHLLQTRERLGLVVGELQPLLALHRPLAQVDRCAHTTTPIAHWPVPSAHRTDMRSHLQSYDSVVCTYTYSGVFCKGENSAFATASIVERASIKLVW